MEETKVSEDQILKRKAVLDKTTGKDLMKKFEEEEREQIEATKKKFMPPVVTEAKCKVCTSHWRQYIEWCLNKGYSYESIEKSVPDDDEGKKPSRKSISNHYRNHMKIEDAVARAEIEEEALNIGRSIDKGTQRILTERGILKTLIQKAFSDAQDGLISVEAKDLIQMLKLQREIEEKTSNVKSEQSEVSLRLFLRAVKNVFSDTDQIRLAQEIKRLREQEEITEDIETYVDGPPEIEEVNIVNAKISDT